MIIIIHKVKINGILIFSLSIYFQRSNDHNRELFASYQGRKRKEGEGERADNFWQSFQSYFIK